MMGGFAMGKRAVVRSALLALIATLLLVQPASAQEEDPRRVTDPAGDAMYGAPGFMDIVGAEVTESGQGFRFQMSVAAPIPAAPPPTPPGTNQIQWDWVLDTDPTTFPAGAPFPAGSGQARPAEFIIHVTWNGSSFSAYLTDRRPLLSARNLTRRREPLAREMSAWPTNASAVRGFRRAGSSVSPGRPTARSIGSPVAAWVYGAPSLAAGARCA